MSKTTKNSVIIIIAVIVTFGLIWLAYNHFKTEPISTDNIINGNIIPNYNEELNDIESDDLNINIEQKENEIESNNENTTENKDNENITDTNNSYDEYNQITPRETKAINLAKKEWIKEWENTKGVQFNVSVQSNEKYLVTVYDIKTTRLIKGYIVDVDTEIVDER